MTLTLKYIHNIIKIIIYIATSLSLQIMADWFNGNESLSRRNKRQFNQERNAVFYLSHGCTSIAIPYSLSRLFVIFVININNFVNDVDVAVNVCMDKYIISKPQIILSFIRTIPLKRWLRMYLI